MSKQIAVRIPDEDLDALDQAVSDGVFASRAEGVRVGISRVVSERREREVARQYREAYEEQPLDPAVGETGAALLTEAVSGEERGRH